MGANNEQASQQRQRQTVEEQGEQQTEYSAEGRTTWRTHTCGYSCPGAHAMVSGLELDSEYLAWRIYIMEPRAELTLGEFESPALEMTITDPAWEIPLALEIERRRLSDEW